jgi:phosphoglycerol transferase MdoB-like AlkP superfamily enzyme
MDNVMTEFLGPHEAIDEKTFAEQSLARSIAQPEKIFHYFFNFKSHGPYQGYSDSTRDRFSIGKIPGLQVNYLATMSEVDQMIESLFSLQRDGFEKGENVLILTADHRSGVHAGTDKISRTRIPAMICHESFTGTDVANVFGTIDLFPTILDLFGLPIGDDVLGQSMLARDENAVLSPHRLLIYRETNGEVVSRPCGEQCDRFMDYTDQHLMLSP